MKFIKIKEAWKAITLVGVMFVSFINCCCAEASVYMEYEVGEHIKDHMAFIPVKLNNHNAANTTIYLANSSAAENIILDLISDTTTSLNELNIKCISQCNVEIQSSKNINVRYLNLINAALAAPSSIRAEKCTIQASEAIQTVLPNCKMEITIKPSEDMLMVQKLLHGVNIIPGSGEYIYDTEVQYKAQQNGDDLKPINANNPDGIADAAYNMKVLKRVCHGVNWVAPVVSWFGTEEQPETLDVAKINVHPSVESNDVMDNWQVGKYSRGNTPLVLKDAQGRANYGGTVNDASLVRYIDALKGAGYKVMFYPMLFMDLPGKPWRGHISAQTAEDVHDFFNKEQGYSNFILHYAQLLKGRVNAFVIGSELRSLTQTIDKKYGYPDPKRYPAVLELIELARKVKEILGLKVVVTYAADWSEYHHDDSGYHHLDPLWASNYIDVVGIDAYLPITAKTMGDISLEEIKRGWESGELWDFYYNKGSPAVITPEWGLKQIEYWWENEHIDNGVKTKWRPKMKPIWFTEFGFPSMHMATNQPNIFWNPATRDGGVPKRSSGKPDFALQMRAIRATLEYWQAKSDIVQNMFLWAWDARPYPYFPERLDLWSDGMMWSRGHWINGKIEAHSKVTVFTDSYPSDIVVNADEVVVRGLDQAPGVNMRNIIEKERCRTKLTSYLSYLSLDGLRCTLFKTWK